MKNLRTRLASVVAALALVTATAGVVSVYDWSGVSCGHAGYRRSRRAGDLQAMASSSANVTGASYAATTGGTPNGTSDSPLAGFPTDGATFGILTSGDVNTVPIAGHARRTPTTAAAPVRGDTRFRRVDPEDRPERPDRRELLDASTSSSSPRSSPATSAAEFNDAFIAELDSSTWTTSGSTIIGARQLRVRQQRQRRQHQLDRHRRHDRRRRRRHRLSTASATTPQRRDALLHASHQVTPGAHSLYLSIFDQGDRSSTPPCSSTTWLSASYRTPPSTASPARSRSPRSSTSRRRPRPARGTSHTVTATLTNGDGAPMRRRRSCSPSPGPTPHRERDDERERCATFSYTGADAGHRPDRRLLRRRQHRRRAKRSRRRPRSGSRSPTRRPWRTTRAFRRIRTPRRQSR